VTRTAPKVSAPRFSKSAGKTEAADLAAPLVRQGQRRGPVSAGEANVKPSPPPLGASPPWEHAPCVRARIAAWHGVQNAAPTNGADPEANGWELVTTESIGVGGRPVTVECRERSGRRVGVLVAPVSPLFLTPAILHRLGRTFARLHATLQGAGR
jgi:hypothetical protein